MRIWFKGVCDAVLAKCEVWLRDYDKGEEHRITSGTYIDPKKGVVDAKIIRSRTHYIRWTELELDTLIAMLAEIDFQRDVVEALRKYRLGMKEARMLPGGAKLLAMSFQKPIVEDIVKALKGVRDGKAKEKSGRPGSDIEAVLAS